MGTNGNVYGDDVVCSLFDGDYHLGLGALVNSLFKFGFRGLVYAAYRGPLPPWAADAREGTDFHELHVGDGCAIRFVKVDFAGHLANYKPDFILFVLRTHASRARRVYYFDVDIVVKAPWRFFQAGSRYVEISMNLTCPKTIRCERIGGPPW